MPMAADSKNSGWLTVTLVGVAALLLGVPRAGRTGDRAEEPASPKPETKAVAAPPRMRSATTHVLEPLRRNRSVDTTGHGVAGALAEIQDDRMSLTFQVATVPDPIDTRFGLRFDSALDAMQLAVESQGYTLDRFYLPWRPTGDQPQRKENLVSTRDAALSGATEAAQVAPAEKPAAGAPTPELRNREQAEPGVMLFRRVSLRKPDEYFVLFLVGESPVSGIHQDAMALALDLIRDAHDASPLGLTTPQPPVRIVGPYFSGGAASLSRVISAWTHGFQSRETWDRRIRRSPGWFPSGGAPEFIVRCGSAISIRPRDFRVACLPATTEFKATVIPYAVVMSSLLEHFKRLNGGLKLRDVVILSESSTAFGGSSTAPTDKSETKPAPDQSAVDWDVRFEDYLDEWREIKYPFHISQVAIEYADTKPTAPAPNDPALSGPSSKLKIPFDEIGKPTDTVPSLSPRTTAARDEFIISTVLATLAREETKYVGIVATDTRDVIFLASLIREFCPDVQIFSLEADLILAHPQYIDQLRGLVLASPYPLNAMTQPWTHADLHARRRHQFAYISDQGDYNAVLTHFADLHETLARRDPAAASERGSPLEQLFDYARPGAPEGQPFGPPVWLSVVGQHGLWPIAYRAVEEGDATFPAYRDYVYQAGIDRKGSPDELAGSLPLIPSWGWLSSYFGFSGVLLALCWLAHTGVRHDRSEARGWSSLSRFWPFRNARTRTVQDFYVVSCLLVLGMLSIPVSAVALSWIGGPFVSFGFALYYYTLFVLLAFLGPCLWYLVQGHAGVRVGSIAAANIGLALAALVVIGWQATPGQPGLPVGEMARFGDVLTRWLDLMVFHVHLIVLLEIGWVMLARLAVPIGNPGSDTLTLFLIRAVPAIVSILMLAGFEWVVMSQVYRTGTWNNSGGNGEGFRYLFFNRVTTLGDGVSPVAPLLLLGAAFLMSLVCRLRTLYLYDRVLNPVPSVEVPSLYLVLDLLVTEPFQAIVGWLGHEPPAPPPRDPTLGLRDVDAYGDRIDNLLLELSGGLRRNPLFLLSAGLILFVMVRMVNRVLPTIDGWVFSTLTLGMLAGMVLVVATSFARFLLIWRQLRELLRTLALYPMQAAYDRLPPTVSAMYGRYLDQYPSRLSSLRLQIQQWLALIVNVPETRAIVENTFHPAPVPGTPDELALEVADRFREEVETAEYGDVRLSETRIGLRRTASYCLDRLRNTVWPRRTIQQAYGTAPGDPPGGAAPSATTVRLDGTELLIEPVQAVPPPPFATPAEDFLAMEFLGVVSQYAAHLRNLATFLAVAPLLLVWAVGSYPFVPQRYMLVFLWAGWAVIVAGVVSVYVELDRNAFLSRVSRTKPNQVTLDRTFVTSILTTVVPILGVVLSQFSFIAEPLTQWLGPFLRVLR